MYTPNDLFDGTDSFTFIVNDDVFDSNIATVTINVNNCLTNLSEADPIENCDIEGSGFSVFDLTSTEDQIFEGLNQDAYLVTYHESISDAQNNVNPIDNPSEYTNTNAYNQNVYMRIVTDESSDSYGWNHYTMVFGTGNNYSYENIKFYVNGEEIVVGCGHNWGGWTYELPNENFVVGKPSDIYNYFSGEIDDIAIWNRALGSGEIEDYYLDSNLIHTML